ncbi:MAG: hypothetical protein IJF78_16895 [Clostridia bacterium]|nr:hypothetical protein [Clostridia bacterium]
MIYLITALLLTAALIGITVLETRKPSTVWKWLNLILCSAGVLIVIICRTAAEAGVSRSGQSETWMSWARDMFAQHYRVSLPVLLVLLGILVIAFLLSLPDKRNRSAVPGFLRRTVGILASVLLLMMAPLYAFMTANEIVPLDTLILLSGIGESLILRLVYALEGFFGGISRKQR